MATLARLNVILGLDTKRFTRGIDRAQFKLRRLGRNMDATGRRLTTGLSIPLALAGAAAVKMSLSFEDSMTKIITLVGVSEDQVREWSALLITLGPKLGKTPTELAEALFQVTSAGFRGAEAIAVLTRAAEGSNLGLGETKVVADAVTSAINAWGKANLDAADATAILRAAVKEGKAEADSIAPVIGTVANVAAEMGVEFHEVAAAIAAMTRTGAGAEIAVTQLGAILSTIQKGAPKTRKGLLDIGSSLEEVRDTLRGEGLIGLLTKLSEKFGDNEDAAASVFGNVRALRGVFAVVGQSAKENIEIFANLAKTTGVDLAGGLAVVADKEGFKLARVFSQLTASAIVLGDAILPYLVPAVQKLGEFIATVTNAFTELDPQIQKIILAVLGLSIVLGPVLVVLGLVATGLGAISVAMVGWAAGIGVAVLAVAKHWGTLRKALADFVEFASPALAEFKDFALEVFKRIKDFALEVWPIVQEIVTRAVERISALWKEHGATILDVVNRAWTVAKLVILGALEVVVGAIEVFLHLLNNDWPAAWESLKDSAATVMDTIGRVVRASLLRLQAGWHDFGSAANMAFVRILGGLRQVASAFLELPFVDPIARAAGEKALVALDVAMGGIAVRATAAKLEAMGLNSEADRLVAPLVAANNTLVEMQSGWVTVGAAAETAADNTVIAITRAGDEIKNKLKGGFGQGVEEGAEAAKVTYQGLSDWVSEHPLRPEIDMEYVQRQLAELNLVPDTGGALP